MSAGAAPGPPRDDDRAKTADAEAILAAIFEQAEVGMTVIDQNLVYRRVNEAFASYGTGLPAEDYAGRTIAEALPPEIVPLVEAATRQVLDSGQPIVGRELVARPEGNNENVQWVRSNRYPIRSETGDVVGVVSVVINVTDLKKVHARLDATIARERFNRTLLDALFETAPLGIAVVDRDLRYTRVNAITLAETGVSADKMIGRMPSEIFAPAHAAEIERALRYVFDTGQPIVGHPQEVEVPIGSGNWRHFLISRYPLRGPDGEIVSVATVRSNVTALRQVEAELADMLAREQSARRELEETRRELAVMNEQLARLATTDPLTGLPNRSSLQKRISEAVGRAAENGEAVALVYIDLDGFKIVNDTLGHAAGDEVLRVLSGRLRACARQTDLIGRIGGDEFVVLMPDLDPVSAADIAQAISDRVRLALTEPLSVQGAQSRVSASIGFSIFPRDAANEHELLAKADAAMYGGKQDLGHPGPTDRTEAGQGH